MPTTAISVCLLAATADGAALVGTTYRLSLSIGQERGTWMPPKWGASGRRVEAAPTVRFEPNGDLVLIETGAVCTQLLEPWTCIALSLALIPRSNLVFPTVYALVFCCCTQWDHLVVKWAHPEETARQQQQQQVLQDAKKKASLPWFEENAGAAQIGTTVGQWKVKAERATFFLQHEGVERGDISLEPGRLYGTAGAWGALLQKRGNLTIKQKKMGWIPFLPTFSDASFLVGSFEAAEVVVEQAVAD